MAHHSLATDGDLTTYWTAEGDKDQWVGVIWDKPTRFTAIALREFQQPTELSRLQKTDDGTTWVDLPVTPFVSYLLTRPADFFFPAGETARGVRILMSATHQAGLPPGLGEFLVFDTPVPQPQQ